MIIQLKQTRSNLKAECNFLSNAKVIYSAAANNILQSRHVILSRNGKPIYYIDYELGADLSNIIKSPTKKKSDPFAIKNTEGQTVGAIYYTQNRMFFGYCTYHIVIDGNEWQVYDVGLGKAGNAVCIYQNENQVALIEKTTVVRDNKDYYTLYLEDDMHIIPTCLFGLYYDCTKYSNSGEAVYKSVSIQYEYSLSKELKAKYDPNFKLRIMQQIKA